MVDRGKAQYGVVDVYKRQNKAREISNIYGIEFKKNLVIIDAREDTEKALKTFEGTQLPPATTAFRPRLGKALNEAYARLAAPKLPAAGMAQ